jgi:hypothetical protein
MYPKPDPSAAATATSLPIASATNTYIRQALPYRTLNARTHARTPGRHACIWFAWYVATRTDVRTYTSMLLRTCCTYVPKSASFVTTARAGREVVSVQAETAEKARLSSSFAIIPPNRQKRVIWLRGSVIHEMPPRHIAKRLKYNCHATRGEVVSK